jgi:hypothetical protein
MYTNYQKSNYINYQNNNTNKQKYNTLENFSQNSKNVSPHQNKVIFYPKQDTVCNKKGNNFYFMGVS